MQPGKYKGRYNTTGDQGHRNAEGLKRTAAIMLAQFVTAIGFVALIEDQVKVVGFQNFFSFHNKWFTIQKQVPKNSIKKDPASYCRILISCRQDLVITGLFQVIFQVVAYTLFQAVEAFVVACFTQLRHIGLGIVLVIFADVQRRIDIVDLACQV